MLHRNQPLSFQYVVFMACKVQGAEEFVDLDWDVRLVQLSAHSRDRKIYRIGYKVLSRSRFA